MPNKMTTPALLFDLAEPTAAAAAVFYLVAVAQDGTRLLLGQADDQEAAELERERLAKAITQYSDIVVVTMAD